LIAYEEASEALRKEIDRHGILLGRKIRQESSDPQTIGASR